jgi:hypothetical protein
MGNITNKEITKSNICFDYFSKEMIQKFGRKQKIIYNLKNLKDCDLATDVIVYKNLTCLCIQPTNNIELADFQKQMIKPFLNQICINSPYDFLDKEYVSNSLNNPYIIIGFSQGNTCKLIAFCSISYLKNIVNNNILAELDIICATTAQTDHNLQNAGKEYSHYFKKNRLGYTEIKIGFGKICIYFACKLLKTLGYKDVILYTNYNLIPYYNKLGFKLGYPDLYTVEKLVEQNGIKIPLMNTSYVMEILIKQTIEKNFVSLHKETRNDNILFEKIRTKGYALFMKNLKHENIEDNIYCMFHELNETFISKLETKCINQLQDLDFIDGLSDLFDINSEHKIPFYKNWDFQDQQAYSKYIDYTEVSQNNRPYDI